MTDDAVVRRGHLDRLTAGNLDDLARAFRFDRAGAARPLLEWLARFPARRFARDLQGIDDLIGRHGLAPAGRRIVDRYARRLSIEGLERVPPTGPLLVLANHPGTVDAASLWIALAARPDLRIVAADRDVLRAMPHLSRRLLLVDPEQRGRTGLLRRCVDVLRDGGALLTFPAGRIEPDAALHSAPSDLQWSNSADLLVRLAQGTVVLPVAVSGVISGTALAHPVTRLFEADADREWTAATLQVLFARYRDTEAVVRIGEPIRADDHPSAAARAQVVRLLGGPAD